MATIVNNSVASIDVAPNDEFSTSVANSNQSSTNVEMSMIRKKLDRAPRAAEANAAEEGILARVAKTNTLEANDNDHGILSMVAKADALEQSTMKRTTTLIMKKLLWWK